MAQKQDHFLTVQEFYLIRKSKNLFVSIKSIGIISKKSTCLVEVYLEPCQISMMHLLGK